MPIYEYRRPDGTTFEIQQSFSDETLTHDPDTGVKVVRVLHAPAVHFKGKGFYNTDYGTRKRQRETAAAAEGGSKSSDSSSESASAKGDSGTSSSDSSSSASSSSDGGSSGGDPKKSEKSTAKDSPAKSKDAKPAAAKS
jgi:predicted nucleic acid-binding Zn ribbon protein